MAGASTILVMFYQEFWEFALCCVVNIYNLKIVSSTNDSSKAKFHEIPLISNLVPYKLAQYEDALQLYNPIKKSKSTAITKSVCKWMDRLKNLVWIIGIGRSPHGQILRVTTSRSKMLDPNWKVGHFIVRKKKGWCDSVIQLMDTYGYS